MKILLVSDTHFEFDSSDWPEADVLIHAGDLMYSGYPEEWYPRLESLKNVEAKHKFLIPGNHDYHIYNYEGMARSELRKRVGTRLVSPSNPLVELPNGMKMLGIPYVTGLDGWAYNTSEEWILEWLNSWTSNGKDVPDIIVSHAPMYGVLDAIHPEASTKARQEHVGSFAFNKWFYSLDKKPLMWVHGHIHENVGKEVVDGCRFYNVALCDRDYKHTNFPVLIEL